MMVCRARLRRLGIWVNVCDLYYVVSKCGKVEALVLNEFYEMRRFIRELE